MAARLKTLGKWVVSYAGNKYSVLGPRFYEIAKVELRPPTPGEMSKVPAAISKIVGTGTSGQWKNLTTQEAFLNCLVALEVYFLFYVGECIGRKRLPGYNIEGTTHYSWIHYLV